MTDLSKVHDHPAYILQQLHDEYDAAEILRAHEVLHGVTFAALDNDALARVRETYDNLHPQIEPRDTLHATEEFAAAVRDLLGLDD